MTDASNKAIARAYFEQFLNKGDTAAADEIFVPNVRFHYPLDDLSGVTAVKSYVSAVRTAFPDIQFTVADLISERDLRRSRRAILSVHLGT
jgi:predicted ester cyclase